MTKTKVPTGKIEKLTPAQVGKLVEYRDRWLKHGLSTAPADRLAAVGHVHEAYRAAGLEPPRFVIWLGSPMAGVIGAHLLTQLPAEIGGAQVWDQVGAQVRAQVWDQVWDQVGAQVRAQVGAQVGAQVRDQVWAQVWAQVRDQVRDQVWAQVRAQVWDQVGAQVGAQVGRCGYGSHDANWLGFYEYFAEVCGLKEKVAKLKGLIGIGQTCGWWWPFKGAVILTERPSKLSRDANNRLHCEDGLAIEYPDGWGFAVWHGTRVPAEWVVDRASLTASAVLAEQNAEQRRAGCEIIGWTRVLEQLKAVVVDADPEPAIGTLLRCDLPGSPGAQFIKVRCGTGRDFVLPVPMECKTALEANAWTYNLDALDYKQLEARS